MANSPFGINLPNYNPTDPTKAISGAGALFDKAFGSLQDVVTERQDFNQQVIKDQVEGNTQDAIAKLRSFNDPKNFDNQANDFISGLGKDVDIKQVNDARREQEVFLGEKDLRDTSLALSRTKNDLAGKELSNYDANQEMLRKKNQAAIDASKASQSASKSQQAVARQKLNEANADIQAVSFLRNQAFNTLVPQEELDQAGAQIESKLAAQGITPGTDEFKKEFDIELAGARQTIARKNYSNLEDDPVAAEQFEDSLQVSFLNQKFGTKLGYEDLLTKTGLVDSSKSGSKSVAGGLDAKDALLALDRETKTLETTYKNKTNRAEKKIETNTKELNRYISPKNHDEEFVKLTGGKLSLFTPGTEGGNSPMADINDKVASELEIPKEQVRILQNMAIADHGYEYFKKTNDFSSDGLDVEKYKDALKRVHKSLKGVSPDTKIEEIRNNLILSKEELNTLLSNSPEKASLIELENKLKDISKQQSKKAGKTPKAVEDQISKLDQTIQKRKLALSSLSDTIGIRG